MDDIQRARAETFGPPASIRNNVNKFLAACL